MTNRRSYRTDGCVWWVHVSDNIMVDNMLRKNMIGLVNIDRYKDSVEVTVIGLFIFIYLFLRDVFFFCICTYFVLPCLVR